MTIASPPERHAADPGVPGDGTADVLEPAAVEDEAPTSADGAAPARRRRRVRVSIQSKLLLMLLATSVVSAVVVGFVGYHSGTDALRQSAFDRLTEVRESRSREIELQFDSLVDAMVIYTRGRTAIEAVEAFTSGFDELLSSELTEEQNQELFDYYDEVFVPTLTAERKVESEAEGFLPDNLASRYLQTYYTVPHRGDFDAAVAVDDAGDGSAWSAAHAVYHDYFRELAVRFQYEDVMILDTEGRVVYSAYKGIDLGANVLDGRFDRSGLADVYRQVMAAGDADFVGVTDFDRYQPSYAVPTAWAASPIGTGDEVFGVLAVQIPFEAVNDIMTAGGDWEDQGLGATGETYLAGPDFLMRSVSRLVLEDPEAYLEAAVSAGLDPETAEFAAQVQGTTLLQTVKTEAVERALQGETGTLVGEEYLGREALVAYAPVETGGLPWVIVAKLDTAEAFEPSEEFARQLAISTAAIVFVVCLASLVLAQVFVRPVRRLVDGVRRVASGDLGARVDARSNDEFGDLAVAFNDMSRSLQNKQELLEGQQAENERLLLSLMPENVARRYREGEETIAEDHQDVAVVFADIIGFDDFSAGKPSAQALATLNGIVRSFNEAADRIGVERVRTLRSGYLATSGLTVRRVDNVRRAVDFADELTRIVTRFNAQHDARLGIRAGVDCGTVTSGLVGRSNVVFDLWGDAVNLAFQVQSSAGQTGIYVSAAVYDRLRDLRSFEPAASTDGTATSWRLGGPTT